MSVASVASADYNVQLRYNTVSPWVTNTIYENGTAFGGVLTGNYIVEIQAGYPFAGVYAGFCVDPANATTAYTPYKLTSIAEGSGFEAAAWVLNQGYTGTSAVAAQIAVWELTWDWGNIQLDRNLANFGKFSIDASNAYFGEASSIITLALAGMGNGFDQNALGFLLAVSPQVVGGTDYQDYIIKTPIPAAVWLLGSALLGLVGIRRRMTS